MNCVELAFALLFYCVPFVKYAAAASERGCCKKIRTYDFYESDPEPVAKFAISLCISTIIRAVLHVGLPAGTEGWCTEKCTPFAAFAVTVIITCVVYVTFRVWKCCLGVLLVLGFLVLIALCFQFSNLFARWGSFTGVMLLALCVVFYRLAAWKVVMNITIAVLDVALIVYLVDYFEQTDLTKFDAPRQDFFSAGTSATAQRRLVRLVSFSCALVFREIFDIAAILRLASHDQDGMVACCIDRYTRAKSEASEVTADESAAAATGTETGKETTTTTTTFQHESDSEEGSEGEEGHGERAPLQPGRTDTSEEETNTTMTRV